MILFWLGWVDGWMARVRIENTASSAPAFLGAKLGLGLSLAIIPQQVKKLLGVKRTKPHNLLKVRKAMKWQWWEIMNRTLISG